VLLPNVSRQTGILNARTLFANQAGLPGRRSSLAEAADADIDGEPFDEKYRAFCVAS
jgi:hypothetical protein